MLKKRLIFTLLYKDGFFMLSRNFRLQKIGNLEWIIENYNFSNISRYIDELCILNVSQNRDSHPQFLEVLKELSQGCFVPIAVGGGIRTYGDSRSCFTSGADKIILNSSLFEYPELVNEISRDYGQQAIVGSIDLLRDESQELKIQQRVKGDVILHDVDTQLKTHRLLPVGEWYINSVDQDGTGQGLDLEIVDCISDYLDTPLIIAGGVGNSSHIAEGLHHHRVSGVATANLLNFVGDGLMRARNELVSSGQELATWKD